MVFHNKEPKLNSAGEYPLTIMDSRKSEKPKESVWDYPRPPRLEKTTKHLQIFFADVLIADTHRAARILETSHPPVYYVPPGDIRMEFLFASPHHTFCEWKGMAKYYNIRVAEREEKNAAWFYSKPLRPYDDIRNYVAFYPSRMDRCLIDGEVAEAQPGDFYGGWITGDVIGPFKGGPGSSGW